MRRRAAVFTALCALAACGAPGSLEDAYRSQERASAERIAQGELIGYKVAFTTAASQARWGIDEPAHAPLFRSMRVGGTGRAAAYATLLAELEIAFVLDAPLAGPGVDAPQARAAVRSVHAAIELANNRLGANPPVLELIATGIGAHNFALGPAVDPAGVDLVRAECALEVDGAVHTRGAPSDALGDPYAALAWLANALAERGQALAAGQTVLTGALGQAFVTDRPAHRYRASCTDLGAAEVQLD